MFVMQQEGCPCVSIDPPCEGPYYFIRIIGGKGRDELSRLATCLSDLKLRLNCDLFEASFGSEAHRYKAHISKSHPPCRRLSFSWEI